MVTAQEVVERSIYEAIKQTLINYNYTVDPWLFQPNNPINIGKTLTQLAQEYKAAIEALKESNGGLLVQLYGTGNNQARGEKAVPRITIDCEGFLPGDFGFQKEVLEKVEDRYIVSNVPYEAINQYINIHIVANRQDHIRQLQWIVSRSIPNRGYLKPYIYEETPFDGNIFLEIFNFIDWPDTDKGLMEKIYQYEVFDTLLGIIDPDKDYVAINEITLDVNDIEKFINIKSE